MLVSAYCLNASQTKLVPAGQQCAVVVGQSSAPANLNAPYAEQQPPANLRKPLTNVNLIEKQSALLERF